MAGALEQVPEAARDLPRPPRSIPPRVTDTILLVWAAVGYAGYLFSVVYVHGPNGHQVLGPAIWTPRMIVAAVCLPAVIALWWRRTHPVQVLAIALATLLIAYPYPFIFALIALFSAVSRLPIRKGLVAWGATAACIMLGAATQSNGWADPTTRITTSLAGTGTATAIGMYVGVRRSYVTRLRERALFAKALASFLPPEVARMVESSPDALSLEEEVEATILFSDIRGFSTIAETLQPREVAAFVNRHLEAMAEVVSEHSGTLDKFAGDAVMAVFGVPRMIEDHADRALRCAVAMQRRQHELNVDAAGRGLPTCEIGVGVNSGTVIAGTVGGPGRYDYTVIGDAVNVAQRLQAEAAAGEILTSESTLALTHGWNPESAGSRRLKGRSEPVAAFRLRWQDAIDAIGPATT